MKKSYATDVTPVRVISSNKRQKMRKTEEDEKKERKKIQQRTEMLEINY